MALLDIFISHFSKLHERLSTLICCDTHTDPAVAALAVLASAAVAVAADCGLQCDSAVTAAAAAAAVDVAIRLQ